MPGRIMVLAIEHLAQVVGLEEKVVLVFQCRIEAAMTIWQ
jgi:hypothetical protein